MLSLLFSTKTFSGENDSLISKVRRSIELLQASHFTETTPEALATQIFTNNQLGSISIDTENITQSQPDDCKVEIADATTTNGKRLVDGRKFIFKVPFIGNKVWMQTAPGMAPSEPPFGELQDTYFTFQLQSPNEATIDTTLAAYQTNVTRVSAYVAALQSEISVFNENLQQYITTLVLQRKAQIDKNYSDAEAFGVPID